MTNLGTDTRQFGGAGRYLIVMTQILVAEDLRGAILEHDPQAEVMIATSLQAAERRFGQDAPQLSFAFVAAGPGEMSASGWGARLCASGTQVVLLGEEAEQHGMTAGFAVLMQPFKTEDVLSHLRVRTARLSPCRAG